MHPDLEKLIALQAHDVEAKRLRDEMIALPKHVEALETKAKAIQGQRAVIVDLIAKEEALRRRQESDVKDHQAKIARIRKQLDLATTTVQVTIAGTNDAAVLSTATTTLAETNSAITASGALTITEPSRAPVQVTSPSPGVCARGSGCTPPR